MFIEFVKRSGDYDFISPIVNVAVNAAVWTVGGISLAVIASVACKAIGLTGVSATLATGLPITLAVFGACTALASLAYLGYMLKGITDALGKR